MSQWQPRAGSQGGIKGAWRKFRGLPLWVQVVAWIGVVALLGAAMSPEEDEPEQVATQAPTSVSEAQEPAPAVTQAPVTTVRATTSTTQAGPKTTFGSGTHRVGTDIAPGTYRNSGGNASSCYWARLSGFGGSLNEIIANNLGGGQQVVTISASDAGFETRNCGTWSLG